MSEITFACCCERHGLNNGHDDSSGESESHENGEVACASETDTDKPIAYYDKLEWRKVAETKRLPVVEAELTSYEDFFRDYLVRNLPCVLSKEVTSSWLSRQNWVKREGEREEINFEYLLDVYGGAHVSVVNCDDSEYKEGYGARDCREMFVREYIAKWRDLINSRKDESKKPDNCPCLYLKDWHIVRYHQTKPDASRILPYETPIYFRSDFLNESCTHDDSDDFKFCYMGPEGSFTSFHADVYGSYSWSANVFGVKRWLLYPPGKELRFYDHKAKKLVYNWQEPGCEGEDYIEVIQEPGQCIFVPSGWHHVVWNLTDAISINHNWFNGANLTYIWKVLQHELQDVERELEDLRHIPEYKDQCQLVLKANHGMNCKDFLKILELIKCNREKGEAMGLEKLSTFQLKYDLDALQHLVQAHCTVDPS